MVGNEQAVNQDIIDWNAAPSFGFTKRGNLHRGIIRAIKRKNVQTCSKVTKLCPVSIHLQRSVFVLLWRNGSKIVKFMCPICDIWATLLLLFWEMPAYLALTYVFVSAPTCPSVRNLRAMSGWKGVSPNQ